MKHKIYYHILMALLVIGLAGCGGKTEDLTSPVPGEQVAGADWRTYRGYYYGTIHDDSDLDVLYLLFDDGTLAFYLDSESQTLVLDVDLSGQTDPEFSEKNLYFADKNDDSYQDLCLPLADGGLLIWLWNVEGHGFYEAPCSPQGLWLTVKDWPEAAVFRAGEENEQGVAAYTWAIPDGPVFVLERLQPLEGGEEAIAAETAAYEGIDPSAITIEADTGLSEALTYPVYRLDYITGQDEGINENTDIYVRTDSWDFRVHVVVSAEVAETAGQEIEGWLQSLVFQEFGEAEASASSEESPDLTDDEASAMALDLARNEGARVFWWYHDYENEDLEIDSEAAPVEEYYHPIGKFATVEEMKAASEAVFTRRFCQEVLYPIGFEPEEGMEPHFKEIDGVLHSNSNAGGMGWIYGLTDQASVKSREEGRIVVTIISVDPDEEEEPWDFALVLEDGTWKLDNWFSFGAEGMDE